MHLASDAILGINVDPARLSGGLRGRESGISTIGVNVQAIARIVASDAHGWNNADEVLINVHRAHTASERRAVTVATAAAARVPSGAII